MTMNFNTQLRRKAQLVDNTLQRLLDEQTEIDHDLKEALKYTLQSPGKRIRAALVLWCCELVSGQVNHNAEKRIRALNFILSTTAPVIKATVMMANIP